MARDIFAAIGFASVRRPSWSAQALQAAAAIITPVSESANQTIIMLPTPRIRGISCVDYTPPTLSNADSEVHVSVVVSVGNHDGRVPDILKTVAEKGVDSGYIQ